mmetsp:Transcript_4109/g.9726  ORF Transcript_4109/g.9726 Transcript_4109/m.9726 type:complete len:211 (+) Transcript_4109:484-1116(+)
MQSLDQGHLMCSSLTSRASATSVSRSQAGSRGPARPSGAARGFHHGLCRRRRRRGRLSLRRCKCGPSTATLPHCGRLGMSIHQCQRVMMRHSESSTRWMPRRFRSSRSPTCSTQPSTTTSSPRSFASWIRARMLLCHLSTDLSRPRSIPRLPATYSRRWCTTPTTWWQASLRHPRSFGACSASSLGFCTCQRQTVATRWSFVSSARLVLA